MSRVGLVCLLGALCWIGAGCGSGSGSGSGEASETTPGLAAVARYDELFSCLKDLGFDGTAANFGEFPRLIAMTSRGTAVMNARVFADAADTAQAEADFQQTEAVNRSRGQKAGKTPPHASAIRASLVFATYSGVSRTQANGIVSCVVGPK